MAEARVLTAERISLGNSVTASGSARQQSPRGWATSKATWMPSAFASTARITFALDATAWRSHCPAHARQIEAAAEATVPLQQQPDKPKAFKMPDPKLFPSWASAVRTDHLFCVLHQEQQVCGPRKLGTTIMNLFPWSQSHLEGLGTRLSSSSAR
jgi:hypothetical protein